MRNWNNRAKEVSYLLNPAFCSRLLYNTIKTYTTESNRSFPFPLVYFILPLLLHRKTREAISSKSQFINWIRSNEPLLIGFAERTKSLVVITNEALEFLLQSGYVVFSASAELEIFPAIKSPSKTKFTEDNDIKECITKSEHVGKWFARTGKIETIYSSLGVRP